MSRAWLVGLGITGVLLSGLAFAPLIPQLHGARRLVLAAVGLALLVGLARVGLAPVLSGPRRGMVPQA